MIRDQRSQGRSAILRHLRRTGPAARVNLAQRTGLSQATVTAITAELMKAGLIEESPTVEPSEDVRRGRPRVDLRISGSARLVAGVKVAERSISVALLDFAGGLVGEEKRTTFGKAQTTEGLAREIWDVVQSAARNTDVPVANISGIGVGLPGIVDVDLGVVHWSPNLTDLKQPLQDQLAKISERPCFIDNDANLVALAELYFGQGRGSEDFLVVTVESGVGLGIVLNGQIYRGTRGCGAEFGHTKVQIDGALCRCGQRGCLEAYVADYALLRDAALRPGYVPSGDALEDVRALLAQAQTGDQMAASILDRAGRIFAMGLANLVNIFDPQLIILSGEMTQVDYLYAEKVIATVGDQTVQAAGPPPKVVVHRWDDLMWARGAAAYAIEGLEAKALADLADHAA